MKQYINEAVQKAKKLVDIVDTLEACGKENAMRSISRSEKLPYQLLWNLKFRPPKSIAYDLVLKLDEVYRRKCQEAGAALMSEARAALSEEGLNATDRNIVLAAHSVGRAAEDTGMARSYGSNVAAA